MVFMKRSVAVVAAAAVMVGTSDAFQFTPTISQTSMYARANVVERMNDLTGGSTRGTRTVRGTITMDGKSNELKERIDTVKNTKKITTAMKLVAAAKVRRAQDAVLKTRPFSECLQGLFGALVGQLQKEDLDLPLLEQREVKHVLLVTVAGDRGLCGAYNSYAIKKTEQRIKELKDQGLEVELITIGKKVIQYFKRRETNIVRSFECTQNPNAKVASAISQELLNDYLSGETDSVELIYTRFNSLISSDPSIRTLLPLTIRGIEMEGDEIFMLTSKDGKFSVNREPVPKGDKMEITPDFQFEQDPISILNYMLPLYLDGQMLRVLQESVASELAARMQAMQSASDNASKLVDEMSATFNRARQASVTQELMEIVAGAAALEG